MTFTETPIPGLLIIDMDPFSDERGTFSRAFCKETFQKRGLVSEFPQINTSISLNKHTLRGMHYQTGEAAEVKVIRCTRGRIFDVAVDLRKSSPTYGKYFTLTLDENDFKQLYIPTGCAHGFLTLEKNSEVTYLVSHAYFPDKEGGLRWNDPAIKIDWPAVPEVISEKDQSFFDISL